MHLPFVSRAFFLNHPVYRYTALVLVMVLAVMGVQYFAMPQAPAQAAAISTNNCGTSSAGYTSGSLIVTPLHGKAFYTDLKNGVNATYVGFSVQNTSNAAIDNVWIGLDNFRNSSGGASVLSVANSADAAQPVIPSDSSANPLGRIVAKSGSNNGVAYAYFLVKASDVASVLQRFDVRVYKGGSPSANGVEQLNCYNEFGAVSRTLAASANKVTTISVDTASPKLGGLVTVTVNGSTGVGGQGDSSYDADSMWLSPASVSSWPTRALRLESTALTVKYKKNGASTDTYTNKLLVTGINNSNTKFSSDTTYTATYKFRVIGTASSDAALRPVAQIASGTQMKHTSSYPATISLINVTSAPSRTVAVTKAVVGTPSVSASGALVTYKVTLTNTDTTAVSVDEVMDLPNSSAVLDSASAVTYTDAYRTGATLIAANASPAPSKDSSGRYHFVGPFTVAAKSGSTNGVASIQYVMKLPAYVSSSTSYTNQAYGAIGPAVFGSNVSTTDVMQCGVTVTGTTSSTTQSCTEVAPTKVSQTITFNSPPPQGAGTSYLLDATATSGLAVTYSVTGQCSLTGNTVIYTSGGSCTITASQAGDTTYSAASTVSRTVTILAGQTINFAPAASMSTSSTLPVSATSSSGLLVTLTSLDTTICKVGNASSTLGTSGTSATATTNSGNNFIVYSLTVQSLCPLSATQAGDATWGAALSVDRTIAVGLKTEVLTTEATAPGASYTISQSPVSWYVMVRDSTSTGTSITTNPVLWTSLTPTVCDIADATPASGYTFYTGSVTLKTNGVCSLQADQDGLTAAGAQSAYGAAASLAISFSVGATPIVSISAVSAVKSSTSATASTYDATVTVTKAGNTAALNGNVTLQAIGDTSTATSTTKAISIAASPTSGTVVFTLTAAQLAATSPSGNISLTATFASSDGNYGNSQTSVATNTAVYSPAAVTISRGATTVNTGATVTATVTVQGNPAYGLPDGTVTMAVASGGTVSPATAATLTPGNAGSGISTFQFTLTAGGDAAINLVVDASYAPGSTSTAYFSSIANSSTLEANRTIDILAIPHTVTFNSNGGTGTIANQTASVATALTSNAGAMSRAGYTFAGWTTASDGTGTSYADGASYSFGLDLTLYAKWTGDTTNAVTYNDNGATTAHVGGATTYTTGASFTLATAPARTGYRFTGWSLTGANVTTASLSSSATSASPAGYGAVTLTAQWSLNSHTVTFNSNGGTSVASLVLSYGTDLQAQVSSQTPPVRFGWTFTKWQISGTDIASGQTMPDADVTVDAVWGANSNNPVTYNDNSATTASSGGASTYTTASSFTLPTAPARSGYTFTGWSLTGPNVTTASVSNSATTASPNGYGAVTMTAQWSAITTNPVTYDDNSATTGHSGGASTYTTDTSFTLPTTAPLRTGYTFTGWSLTGANVTTASITSSATTALPVGFGAVTLTAQWSISASAVTYYGNGNTGGSVPASTSQNYNAVVTVASNSGLLSRTGYTFVGWNTAANGAGTNYSGSGTDTFTMGTSAVALYAKWTINQYAVNYDGNGSTGGTVPSGSTLNYNSSVTVSSNSGSLVRSGYRFTGWNTAANGLGNSYNATGNASFNLPDSAVTLYAQWTAVHGVSYNANGATTGSTPTDSSLYANNDPVTVATNNGVLARTGYTFGGWNTANDGSGTTHSASGSASFTMGNSAVTLYAKWNINQYAVNYDGNGSNGGSAPVNSRKDYNSSVVAGTYGSLTKTGYHFTGWNEAANGTGAGHDTTTPFTLGAADVTLFAQWAPNPHNVTFNSNGGSSVAGLTISYGTNLQAQVSAKSTPVKFGWTFSKWQISSTDIATGLSMPDNDVTVDAVWTVNGHTLNFNTGTGASTIASASVNYGANIRSQLNSTSNPTRPGYGFSKWQIASADVAGTDTMPDNDLTATAVWVANSNPVTYVDNGATTASSTDGDAVYTTDADFTLPSRSPAKTGYSFTGWRLTGNHVTEASLNANAASAHPSGYDAITLTAQWAINHYTVSYDGNGNSGGSAPASATQDFDSTVTASLNSGTLVKTGYHFAGWNTESNGSGNSHAENATFRLGAGNVILHAQWAINQYTVTYNDNGSTGGAAPADDTKDYSSTITVANHGTLVKEGYSFAGWNSQANGHGTGRASADTFTLDATNVTLYAQWSANDNTITFDANDGSTTPATTTQQITSDQLTALDANGFTRTNYTFAGWSLTRAGAVAHHNRESITTLSGMTLYAQWNAPGSHTIDFDADGGDDVTAVTNVMHGNSLVSSINGATAHRAGYSFVKWQFAGAALKSSDVMPDSDVVLTAIWSPNVNNITYDQTSADTASSSDGDATYSTGAGFTLPSRSPSRTGHTFAGWRVTGNHVTTASLTSNASAAHPVGYDDITLTPQWTVNQYTVTYDGNGKNGGSVPAAANHDFDSSVPVDTNSGSLVKTGHHFVGWNTSADGTGQARAADGTASFTQGAANVILYAQWAKNSYSVTYNDNGSTAGSVPAASDHDYLTAVSVEGNSGGLAKTGHTFAGWNTASNGSGTSRAGGTSFTIGDGNVVLYAKWTVNQYAVSYNGNGNNSGTVPTTTSPNYGSTVSVAPNSGGLSRTGYSFAGWNTAANGSGHDRATNGTFVVDAAPVTLYAKWTINQYSVTYNGNGNTGGSIPTGGNQDFDSTVNVASNSGVLVKTGYTFAGWNTASNGSGTNHSANGSTTFRLGAAPVVLYAKWTANSHVITFDSGTGGSSVNARTTSFGTNLRGELTSVVAPTRVGWSFAKWQLSGADITSSATMPDEDITLVAVWNVATYTVTLNKNDGSIMPVRTTVTFVHGATNALSTPKPLGWLRTGYLFDGWATSPSASTPTVTLTITGPITLYAVWTAVPQPAPVTPPAPTPEPITPAPAPAPVPAPSPVALTLPEPAPSTPGPVTQTGAGTASVDNGNGVMTVADPKAVLGQLLQDKTIGVVKAADLPRTSIGGFAPGAQTTVQATGARTSAQFLIVAGQSLDAFALSQSLAESTQRNTSNFAQVTGVKPVAAPSKNQILSGAVTSDAILTFGLSALAKPITVGQLDTSKAKTWLRVGASVETYLPGSIVYLAVTTQPIILGAAKVDSQGQAKLDGFLPADLLGAGGHNIRVVGTRSLSGITVDGQGNITLSQSAMAEITRFDEGTHATVQVTGAGQNGGTHLAVREVPLDKIVPWWLLWILIALSVIALGYRLFAKRWTMRKRIIVASVLAAYSLVPIIVGWVTSSYDLMAWSALVAVVAQPALWLFPKRNLRRRSGNVAHRQGALHRA